MGGFGMGLRKIFKRDLYSSSHLVNLKLQLSASTMEWWTHVIPASNNGGGGDWPHPHRTCIPLTLLHFCCREFVRRVFFSSICSWTLWFLIYQGRSCICNYAVLCSQAVPFTLTHKYEVMCLLHCLLIHSDSANNTSNIWCTSACSI